MLNKLLSPFFPNTYPLFVLPDKVTAYEATPYFGVRAPARPWVEVPLGKADSGQAMTHVRGALHAGPEDSWHVGLPLKVFTLVNLRLPSAADEDLDQAVRYALLRHVPFDLSQARVDHARAPGGEDLEVSIVQDEQLEPIMAALERANIHPTGFFPALVYVAWAHGRDGVYISGNKATAEAVVLEGGRIVFHAWDDISETHPISAFLQSMKPMLENRPKPPASVYAWECSTSPGELAAELGLTAEHAATVAPVFSRALLERTPFRIGLAQPEMLRRRRTALRLHLGLATVFLLALLALPLAGLLGKKAHLQRLEAEIARIRPQAEVTAEKRREVQDVADSLENIAVRSKKQVNVLELLHELTQVLPGNAWLEAFVFAQDRVRIQGQADSATSIIEAIENSPLFRDARMESPVTKSGARDVFQISAELDR